MNAAFGVTVAAAIACIVLAAAGANWLALIAWIAATGWSLSAHAWQRPRQADAPTTRKHADDGL